MTRKRKNEQRVESNEQRAKRTNIEQRAKSSASYNSASSDKTRQVKKS